MGFYEVCWPDSSGVPVFVIRKEEKRKEVLKEKQNKTVGKEEMIYGTEGRKSMKIKSN